jgi:NCK-associated protein 1
VQYILLHENYQLYVLPKVLESKKLAKSGRTKQKEADLEYNVAKQVEKMLTYVPHSFHSILPYAPK